jgi:hypothetical protein
MHAKSRKDQERDIRVDIIVVHNDDKEEEGKRIASDLLTTTTRSTQIQPERARSGNPRNRLPRRK